jgi:hypothetical protein
MPRHPNKKKMIEAARRIFQEEGTIEIDDEATISRAEKNPEQGAYVQAWVWVTDEEARRKEG